MEELLSFVFDYKFLSEDMENEFMAKTPIFLPLKSDTMVITRGKRALAEMASIAIYGKPFDEVIAEQKAEQAKILAKKEAEQDLERRNTIHSLLKINFTPEKISEVLGFDLDYVLKVAANK
jgi:hypothetical protein